MPHHHVAEEAGESRQTTTSTRRDITWRNTVTTGLRTMPVAACTISRHIAHCDT